MKITKVTVGAKHVFPNPDESFSNFTVGVELEATIGPLEPAHEAVQRLRIMTDSYVAQHRQAILDAKEIARRSRR